VEEVQNKGQAKAEDDDEFYVDEDTGEHQALKPIYTTNVGGNITSIAWAAYKTTINAGGSVVDRQTTKHGVASSEKQLKKD